MIGRVGGPTDKTDRWICGLTDGRTGKWMDGWEGGWKNAQMYGRTDRLLYY